jgi:murein DD-endopeptidase MepM/ murein hydrolase activator NlpD
MKLYRYNKYDMTYQRFRWLRLKPLLVLFLIIISSGILSIYLFYNYYETDREKALKNDIAYLTEEYSQINGRIIESEVMLAEIRQNDSIIYRSIFEAEDLTKNRFSVEYDDGSSQNYSELVNSTNQSISELFQELERQKYSINELLQNAKNKEDVLSHIPAIQPIDNKDLKRTASGWGYRIHPIYHIRKFHYGFDFTAKTGTPVYTTGDGVVEFVIKSTDKASQGYGNLVIINHGYGYKTLYAHLSKFRVKKGQAIKRGAIIAEVGSTGLSTGPHLHYEVIKDGKKVNPVNFFFSDLSPEEFGEIVKISNNIQKSFD